MIKIRNNDSNQIIDVVPTMFPDKTSQVWKLPIENWPQNTPVTIIWNFEHEGELMHVSQLTNLLINMKFFIAETFIPYLPYARQDKVCSNELTFAKSVFMEMLKYFIARPTTLDVHSQEGGYIKSYSPEQYILKAVAEFQPDAIVFPDAGAYKRYADIAFDRPYITLKKVRDQLTGNILGTTLDEDMTNMFYYNGQKIIRNVPKFLMVDDICDGGATFSGASMFLHQEFTCDIGLYVTHGIYSKGFDGMINSGISRFYTTKSLPHNVAAYELDI